jgi:ammonium transporter, Amt family
MDAAGCNPRFPGDRPDVAQQMSPAGPPVLSTLNTWDTAWVLTSTALVLMMTIPGLEMFYGGMVRKVNAHAMVMQSFAVACLAAVMWTLVGYSFAFTSGSSFLGGGSHFWRGRSWNRST